MGEVGNTSNKTFFLPVEVESGCIKDIKHRFETLIESKREAPYTWYKELGLDKGYASKIRRGLVIPPEYLRIKIAGYFEVDSSVLWKAEEILEAGKGGEE